MDGEDEGRDDAGRSVFEDRFGPAARIAVAAAGAFTFWAPWDLLIRLGHAFELAAIPFWILSIGALAVGVPLLAAALFGLERTLIVDGERRRIVEKTRGSFGLAFDRSRRFEDAIAIEVTEETSTDGPPTWRVAVRFAGARRPWPIHTFATEAAARAVAEEIRVRVGTPGA